MQENKSRNKLSVVLYQKDGQPKPAGIKESVFNGCENGEEVYLNYFIPCITSSAYNNLYGRIMTLIEATTDKSKLKSVKSLFQRELNEYFENLERSVKEIASDHTEGQGYYYKNVYVYEDLKHGGRLISDVESVIDI